jgi:hypothetical protein
MSKLSKLLVWLAAIAGFLGGDSAGEYTGYRAAILSGIKLSEYLPSEHLQALVLSHQHAQVPSRLAGAVVAWVAASFLISKGNRITGLLAGTVAGTLAGGVAGFIMTYFRW